MTNLGDLEIFASVVSTGSMSLAGRALGFSPAVISKRIKRLEDRLGTRLLQRTTRQISLTEAGQGFHDRVLSILAGLEEAEAYIAGRSAQMQGTLKISAPTSFGRMHIAPHLKRFMDAHPDLAISLMLTDDFTDIVGGGFDLAIRIAELTDSSLVARRLAPVRRVLCASPDYIAAKGAPGDIDDLRRHLCLPAHNGDAWRLEGPRGALTFRPDGLLITTPSTMPRCRRFTTSNMAGAIRSKTPRNASSRHRNSTETMSVWPCISGAVNRPAGLKIFCAQYPTETRGE